MLLCVHAVLKNNISYLCYDFKNWSKLNSKLRVQNKQMNKLVYIPLKIYYVWFSLFGHYYLIIGCSH